MSISLVLVPAAIGLIATTGLRAATSARSIERERRLAQEAISIETIFNDASLLEKTLREHGLPVDVISENQMICQVGQVKLDYVRKNSEEPFVVNVIGVEDYDEFIKELECFDLEYKQNVQGYTYEKLVEGVNEKNMNIAEETVLEDNSILLTIDVRE